MSSWRAGALVFVTSAAVLVLEIIAGRLMAPYVGVSLDTFTAIIGTVLAGIAAGAAIGGHIADRHDAARLLGPTLVLAGALSWLALPALRLVGPAVGTGPVGIVALAASTFLAPTAVLSAVAPMVAKLRLDRLADTGSVVGGLSAAGTAGALAGTFLTGFVLVVVLPTSVVVIGVGALLVVGGLWLTWRLGGARPGVGTALVVLIAGAGALLFPAPCDAETPYSCVRIIADEDRPGGRSLILDRARHAHVDLDDPTHLELRYVRLFAQVVAASPPGPLEVLHLGGGGFTFPGYLAEVRPGSTQTVIEIDPELPEIARAELGLRDRAGLEIVVGDARTELDALGPDLDGTVDLVIGDAFAGTSVPWHLTTEELTERIAELLAPGGRYVMNVIDGGANRYARAQAATLAEVFDHVAVIVPPEGVATERPVNQVLIGSAEPIADLEIDARDGRVLDPAETRAFIDGAWILTDDHAPADQLMLRRQ